jgi:hypothetical protein
MLENNRMGRIAFGGRIREEVESKDKGQSKLLSLFLSFILPPKAILPILLFIFCLIFL